MAEPAEVDEPCRMWLRWARWGGHPVHPHALAPRVPPHPGSHLCSGGREKDPPAHRPAPPLPQAPATGGQGRASLEGTWRALAFMGPPLGRQVNGAPHGAGVA